MSKKRVNISIDEAVHTEMGKFLKLSGGEFSDFVEQMAVRFLASMRPMIRRMEAAQAGGAALTPSEVRVLFLQVFGSVQIDTGVEMMSVMQEIDMVEAEHAKKEAERLVETSSVKPAIHTLKVRKTTKAKQQ